MEVTDFVDRGAPSPRALAASGWPGYDGQDAGLDPRIALERLYMAAGLNTIIQVNDCETTADWTESDDGTFDMTCAATGKRVGTNCLKLTSTATCDGTQYVETKLINESAKPNPVGHTGSGIRQMDWRDTRYLGFWIHNESAGDYSTAGEMKVAIVYDGGQVSAKANVQALVDDVHQWFEIDLVSEEWELDQVEAIRFYATVASGEDLYVDDILRYQISYGRGPMYGCMFPIKSAVTLTDGDTARWSVDGLIAWTSAAAVTDLGEVKVFSNGLPTSSLVGTATRKRWGFIPGINIHLVRANAATVAGEGLELAANRLHAGVSTTVDENATAKGLEAAGAQYDDIFAIRGVDTSFIS